jgi:hypothetical protein
MSGNLLAQRPLALALPPHRLQPCKKLRCALNVVQFDAAFTGTNGVEGLLSVFWNTNQIGMIDERATSPGLHTYRFTLPATVTNGLYTLSFRLDAFNATASSITVTNVTTGFAGMEQPFTLAVVGSTNRIPTLKLTGATNFGDAE